IGATDLADDVGLRQHQQIVVALEVVRMPRKAAAAEIGFLEAIILDHHAPGAIEHENPLASGARQPFEPLLSCLIHAAAWFCADLMPRMLQTAKVSSAWFSV